jgi:pimeloyl-ACP methyl ester carboxylesterase
MDFVSEGRAGVYFLEAYDPDRIPVLFVHGISGYPQQFEALIDGLDRERFQPWLYFYPSGFPLDDLARHLATLLQRLEVQLDVGELAVVAHSMGGLVSRAAILEYERETEREDVRLLVTISTPWGGQAEAAGAAGARVELPPVFQDMSPSSDFLRRLFYEEAKPGSGAASPGSSFTCCSASG